MLKPYIEGANFRQMVADLKELDPKMAARFRKEIRTPSKDLGNQGAAAFPASDPLSNFWMSKMSEYGSRPPVSISLTAGSNRARRFSKLLQIVLKPGTPGYSLAENIDLRRVKTPQGRALFKNLDDRYPRKYKRGRFAFQTIMAKREELYKTIENAMEKWQNEITREQAD